MTRIVALHGFLGTPKDWDAIATELRKVRKDVEFQTVDLNLESHLKCKTIKDWAKKFNQGQKNKHAEKNILLGYSLGGRLALHAALDKPGLWDQVVLLSSHPGLLSDDERQAREKRDLLWVEKLKSSSWTEIMADWNQQEVFQGTAVPVRREEDYSRNQLIHMVRDWSLKNHDIVEGTLAALKHKITWYVGENDKKYVHLFQNLRDLGFIENGYVIPGAGHRLIYDNPMEVADRLVRDLNL